VSIRLVIFSLALVLVLAQVLVRRRNEAKSRDTDRIWTVGRAHALDGDFEFLFLVGFDDRAVAEEFCRGLSNSSVSTRIQLSDNQKVWQVWGSATHSADGIWYQSILTEWNTALATIGQQQGIIATANVPGVKSGFILSTDIAAGVRAGV
jgi:hypothetical protein